MKIFHSRDSIRGIGFYYLNLMTFVVLSIYAWKSPDLLNIFIVLILFLFLLIQDTLWFKKHYYVPQDKILIEKITDLIKEKHTHELLTEFDLRKYLINDRNLKNLQTINREWNGVDYEFKNKDFQVIWEAMQTDIDELLSILHHHVKHSNASNFTVNDIYKGEEANRIRDKIFRSYQSFRRIYVQRMEQQ